MPLPGRDEDAIPYPEPPLTGPRLTLRRWTLADVPVIVAACQDPAIARYSPVIPNPYAETDAIGWVQSQEPARLAGESLDLALAERSTGALLGAIGLHNINRTLRSVATGYWLASEVRGRGYASEALRLLATWVFETLGAARIELTTDPHNVASQRVAERCGFQREGELRSHMLVRHSGERRNSYLYSLLPGELGQGEFRTSGER